MLRQRAPPPRRPAPQATHLPPLLLPLLVIALAGSAAAQAAVNEEPQEGPSAVQAPMALPLAAMGPRTPVVLPLNVSSDPLRASERIRRLIPYMTYYFTQQQGLGGGQQAQYRAFDVSSTAAPLANSQQYLVRGLAVPQGYMTRPKRPHGFRPVTPPPPPSPPPPPPPPSPRPFALPAYADPQLYTARPNTMPQPTPASSHALATEQRTAALLRLLAILQHARRAQQAQGIDAASQPLTLRQALAVVQAAQSLPGAAPATIAKLLLQHQLLGPGPVPPGPTSPPPPPQPTPPRYAIPLLAAPPGPKALQHPFQVTTLAPDTSSDLLYNTVSPTPATPAPSAAPVPVSGPGPSDDDLQNYLSPIRVEVSPNGFDVHSPLSPLSPAPPPPPLPPTTTASPLPPPPLPTPTSTIAPTSLRPYNKYSKTPAGLLGRVTYSQSYPDPDAEGGTPGRAGVDYPTLAVIPPTSFDCKQQRYKGFFGDPETNCQVWHYCDLNGGQASFLCPNGTIFSQVALTCDWWFNVRCASTPQLYVLNERLYKYILPVMPSFPEDYSGPLVDQYLTEKFREQELKSKAKAKAAKGGSSPAPSTTPAPSLAPGPTPVPAPTALPEQALSES